MVILVFGMSTLWEDTNGCDNQYMCALSIYLMTVLSYFYGVIMDREINALGRGNNVVDRLNATYKHYSKGEMELVGQL